MAVAVVCGQRLRLIQLRVSGSRRGLLRPALVGTLDKQGAPGRFTFHKWRSRRFELLGGSLYYYDPCDLTKPKGLISLSGRGVEVRSDALASESASECNAFVVSTPTREWRLRAADPQSKEVWVEALRNHVGLAEAPLRNLEVLTAEVLADAHLLDLCRLSSSDRLSTNVALNMRDASPPPTPAAPATTTAGWMMPSTFAAGARPGMAPHMLAEDDPCLVNVSHSSVCAWDRGGGGGGVVGAGGSAEGSGGGSGAGFGGGSVGGGGAMSRVHLSMDSPLARLVALEVQAAWQRLTTFLGAPLRGCERADGWLQPRSDLPSLPMLPCDLVWRPAATAEPMTASALSRPRSAPKGRSGLPRRPWAARLSGWMLAKPPGEHGVPWRKAHVERRFCVLSGDALTCYKDEAHATRDARRIARLHAASGHAQAASGHAPTKAEGAKGPAGAAAAPTASAATSSTETEAEAALSAVDLRLVTRVCPCTDASAAPHAFELCSLGADGHQLTAAFEPLGGFEGADEWLAALASVLPAAAFSAAREGSLGWNHFPDPLAANAVPLAKHPFSVTSPIDELCAGFLTLADWHGLSGAGTAVAACERPLAAAAAAMLRAACSSAGGGGGALCIDLCQRRPHQWTEGELSLMLAAIMHSATVTSLCLRGFRFCGGGSGRRDVSAASLATRAVAALLGRSASLQRVELRACHLDEAAVELWSRAIGANSCLPLRALCLAGCDGLPRASVPSGIALANIIKTTRAPLLELELEVGSGVGSGASLRAVLDALHRHEERFFAPSLLRRLSLPSEGLDDKHASEALTSLLRRAKSLKQLRLLRGAGGGGGGGGSGMVGSYGGIGGDDDPFAWSGSGRGGGSSDGCGGGWFGSLGAHASGGLCASVLEALHASAPPLECLVLDGCSMGGGVEERPRLALFSAATAFSGLCRLSLAGTGIPTDALCALVALLAHNPARPALCLDCSRNRLGPAGGLRLAAVVRGAAALEALEASDNELGAHAVAAIAEALRGSPALRALGLARNIRSPPRRDSSHRPASHAPPTTRDDERVGGEREGGEGCDDGEDSDESDEDGYAEGERGDLLGTRCAHQPSAAPHRGSAGGEAPHRLLLARAAAGGNADEEDAVTAADRAFWALGHLVGDARCPLESLDVSGDPREAAVPDAFADLLVALARSRTLTRCNVSGHGAGTTPGALGALLHLIRRSRSLRTLCIQRNAFDPTSLRAVLGGWRRRNVTLERLTLFAADPRDPSYARIALAHEAVRSPKLAAELVGEAESLSRRNRRLAEALEQTRAQRAA